MGLKSWGLTDVGLKRSINQDTIYIDDSLGLYIVADGMGGHKGGEVASALAVKCAKEVVIEAFKGNKINPREIISKIYKVASASIHHKSTVENPDLEGMGTTMVLGLYYKGVMYVGNVGDSRCYMFLNKNMWQMTEDHSLVNEQLRAGVISEDEIHMMVGKNVITRSVGYEKEVKADIIQRKLEPGEKLLLCSDGLCGLVSDALIQETLIKNDGKNTVQKCIELAKDAGGDDNISVIVIEG